MASIILGPGGSEVDKIQTLYFKNSQLGVDIGQKKKISSHFVVHLKLHCVSTILQFKNI